VLDAAPGIPHSANCGYRSLEKLTSTNGRLPIRYLPLAIARCQAVGRPYVELNIRPKQGPSTSRLDRRVSDQKAAKELANIIRQLRPQLAI
jgi:hypothetical protein